MECSNALSLINLYNQGKLSGKQKEQFLLHVKNCESCYEELDIQYIVSAGIRGLETDDEMDFDFSTQLHDKVTKELKEIRMRRKRMRIMVLVTILIIGALLAVLLWEGHLLFSEEFRSAIQNLQS